MSDRNQQSNSRNGGDLASARKNWEDRKLNPSLKRG